MKPIREWKAPCPCCGTIILYPEFKDDSICPTLNCPKCNAEFVCPSFIFQCTDCLQVEQCMEKPTVTPLLHKSTWAALFQSRKHRNKELFKRDLNYLTFLNPEVVPPDLVDSSNERVFNTYSSADTVTLETSKGPLVIWRSKPKPLREPLQFRSGFFGR